MENIPFCFDLHPGYSNLIISIRFLYNFFILDINFPFLFLGLSPTKDPRNFPRWAGQNHPCGHPTLWGLWDLTFVEMFSSFLHERTHDYGRKGILDIYFDLARMDYI